MSMELSVHTERAFQRAIDIGERLFVLVLFATFAVAVWHSFALKPYNVLAVISEGLVVVFILIRRDPKALTLRAYDWIIAFAGTSLAMFVRPGGHQFLPSIVGTSFMTAGVLLAIAAKLTLRRSLAIVAANRGIVNAGPYRLVRHPMYAGYVLVYLGFLLNNPLLWNFVVYVATIALLVARILAEENILKRDPSYAAFMTRVHYRLLRGVF